MQQQLSNVNPVGEEPHLISLLALVGPTATGKTALAVALAERLRPVVGCEAVSADSRQVYRGMDIATAKPTPAERARLPHHLLDIISPDQEYSLARYQADATASIGAIAHRRRLPLLVGGTGLYVRAVVDGLAIPAVAPNPALRARLAAEAATHGLAALHARLAQLDPLAAARIDARNPRRLIRALEVCLSTGRTFSAQQDRRASNYRPLLLGLNTERPALYARADARIDAMVGAGLVEETRALVARGYDWHLPAMSSLGYREIGAYLRGELTLDAAVERFKRGTHAYIRRQLTWFRRDPRITWLDAALPLAALTDQAELVVVPWLRAR